MNIKLNWKIILMVAIAILVILGLMIFFTRSKPEEERETPEKIVMGYAEALDQANHSKALHYLTGQEREKFTARSEEEVEQWKNITEKIETEISVLEKNIEGKEAKIKAEIITSRSTGTYPSKAIFHLTLVEEKWKIAEIESLKE